MGTAIGVEPGRRSLFTLTTVTERCRGPSGTSRGLGPAGAATAGVSGDRLLQPRVNRGSDDRETETRQRGNPRRTEARRGLALLRSTALRHAVPGRPTGTAEVCSHRARGALNALNPDSAVGIPSRAAIPVPTTPTVTGQEPVCVVGVCDAAQATRA